MALEQSGTAVASRWSDTVVGGASCDRAQFGIVELVAWGRAYLVLRREAKPRWETFK